MEVMILPISPGSFLYQCMSFCSEYESPQLEVIVIAVEEGFAGSGQLPDREPEFW